ncbi:hypothetical protein WMO40_13410 [Bacillaceae bacterium CLA-AA-H227]|jgi:hypothetical protein|uniref:Uncharacterized protein n=2 Tax=Bacillales TaxID=1385 RepID=A0A0A3JVJ4_9BACL|nr:MULTISPECIES: hypothetical protein [Bacillales]KGR91032.1 hypothetical protein CD30_08090 [Ureibacillus massiliensis 4400831 = CIP 108448 = CCUG 49529]MBD8069952.1 hypothetical protein [Bacillus sp. PS06]MBU5341519.1 hypothetical protein [Caldifermentibacillus hisashii]BDH63251.1 hypothetical protein MTP04_33810 [Lysinibacillus sp. PLM2]
MSFPNMPNVTPHININRDSVINLLLASIALEELGLSHIINAEAEKIQYVLGTLDGQTPPEPATIDDLLKINNSVNQTLKDTIKTQILLQFQLEDLINYEQLGIHVNTASVTAVFEGNTYYASDSAYYHTTGGM